MELPQVPRNPYPSLSSPQAERRIAVTEDFEGRAKEGYHLYRIYKNTKRNIIVEVKTKRQIIFPFSEITTQNNGNKSSFGKDVYL